MHTNNNNNNNNNNSCAGKNFKELTDFEMMELYGGQQSDHKSVTTVTITATLLTSKLQICK